MQSLQSSTRAICPRCDPERRIMASGGTGWGGSWVRPPPCRTALPLPAPPAGAPRSPLGGNRTELSARRGRAPLAPRRCGGSDRRDALLAAPHRPPRRCGGAPRAAALGDYAAAAACRGYVLADRLARGYASGASARVRILRPWLLVVVWRPWRAPPLRPPRGYGRCGGRCWALDASRSDTARTSRPAQQ